jgi:hypothetical protein
VTDGPARAAGGRYYLAAIGGWPLALGLCGIQTLWQTVQVTPGRLDLSRALCFGTRAPAGPDPCAIN